MDHEKIQELLWTADDPGMSSQDRLALSEHLKTCTSCRKLQSRQSAFQKAAKRPDASKDSSIFVYKVMERLHEKPETTAAKTKIFIPRWLFPTVGYGLVGLLMWVAIIARQPLINSQMILLADIPSHAQWEFSETPNTQNMLAVNGGSSNEDNF
jgi:hypothetical protein